MGTFVSMGNKKEDKTMAEVSAGYEEYAKRQKIKVAKFDLFEKAIKKVAKPKKQRGSK